MQCLQCSRFFKQMTQNSCQTFANLKIDKTIHNFIYTLQDGKIQSLSRKSFTRLGRVNPGYRFNPIPAYFDPLANYTYLYIDITL